MVERIHPIHIGCRSHGSTSPLPKRSPKGILNAAVDGELWRLADAQGKVPDVIGWWPAKAVTFVDNHDTGSTQRRWPFPDGKVMRRATPTSSRTPATHAL
ncbi:hypothetical protein EJB05_31607, partial [Eragrostis curvula]